MQSTSAGWSFWSEVDSRPEGRWFTDAGHRHDPFAGLLSCTACGSYEDVGLGGGAGDFALCHDCMERGSPSLWDLYYEQMS